MTEYHIEPPPGSGQPYQSPQPQMPGYGYGGGYPQSPYPVSPGPGEAVVLTIGDIAVTPNSIIVPQGQFPLRGTTWTVQDSTQVNTGIASWAMIVALIGFFFVCLFSLLFLLVKETKYTGFVSVSVSGPGLYHTVQMPPGPMSVAAMTAQVNQARSMAAAIQ